MVVGNLSPSFCAQVCVQSKTSVNGCCFCYLTQGIGLPATLPFSEVLFPLIPDHHLSAAKHLCLSCIFCHDTKAIVLEKLLLLLCVSKYCYLLIQRCPFRWEEALSDALADFDLCSQLTVRLAATHSSFLSLLEMAGGTSLCDSPGSDWCVRCWRTFPGHQAWAGPRLMELRLCSESSGRLWALGECYKFLQSISVLSRVLHSLQYYWLDSSFGNVVEDLWWWHDNTISWRVSGRDFEQTEERRAEENLFIRIHSECGREVFS